MNDLLLGACLLFLSQFAGPEARAFDVSLGSLICSLEGKAQPEDGVALGTVYIVVCSFQDENGGAMSQYSGTLLLQPQVHSIGRSLIWVVRGPRALAGDLSPEDLAKTYTAGGTATAGTMAPLVPKNGDERSLGLFTLQEPVVREAVDVRGRRRPARSDPVATLDLKLIGAPV